MFPFNEFFIFRFAEAAKRGVDRAVDAGCQSPILYVHGSEKFPNAQLVAILVIS